MDRRKQSGPKPNYKYYAQLVKWHKGGLSFRKIAKMEGKSVSNIYEQYKKGIEKSN